MNSKELIKAIDLIVKEKNISPDIIYEALQTALQTAYKKNFNSKTNVRVDINRTTGDIKVYTYFVVVEKYDDGHEGVDEEGNTIKIEPEINRDAQILLEDAKKQVPTITVGETIEEEVTPADFGRVAAGTAKQVVMQKIREAEKNSIIEEFKDTQDELLLGMVAMEDQNNYYIDLGRTRGILPKKDIIPGEKIEMGSNIRVYVTKFDDGSKEIKGKDGKTKKAKGPMIKLSRSNYGFVKRLFELEIPEVADGTIVISRIVREPGIRSKVAIYSTNEKIDAKGSCIGERGSRIAGILKELKGEKLDLIEKLDDDAEFIKEAMVPAKDVIVSITDSEKREALVVVNEENKSLAIGKKGSNIRLASKLTGYKLEIKTMEEINKAGNN